MIADHVIVGDSIRRRAGDVGPGFLAVAGDRIVATGRRADEAAPWIGDGTAVHDAGAGLVTSGFHDDHTFFTSQLLEVAGTDARHVSDDDIGRLISASEGAVFLRNATAAQVTRLRETFGGEGVGDAVLLSADRDGILLTPAARAQLGDPDPASNEQLAPLYARLALDDSAVERAFLAAAARMHRGGVTSVKDIGFDDHLGMLPVIDELSRSARLRLSYSFASQPVREPADLDWAGALDDRPDGGARFHGFKLMTDGSFDEGTADLRCSDPEDERLSFDRRALAREAARILDAGFRLALNADGDAAVRACLDIYAAHRGPLPGGCTVSDASMLDDDDVARLADLGLGVEYYTQILRYPGYTTSSVEGWLDGSQRHRLANLSALLRSGVAVASGSDFPLFDPSLPEALLSSSGRVLGREGASERWPHGAAVPRDDVISIWTDERGALGSDRGRRGLVAGAAADVVVFDRDLLSVTEDELIGASPRLVLASGELVLGG
ncbi:amidohydrolase family protein [Microbacterium sp. H83]|uniref:amidohydrolase family protein n=1 Tax=Microbacterium sp. H83 TaxID=1827324 RepID=UPI0007F54A98|nr:amidohydrolase family protein [Microbacterium sp. H83]OAN35204.1 hypothetical protein A4X16_04960 [Microbacterium sp. H83]